MREVTLKRLRGVFEKKDFKHLQIIGQFNLGFIVATLSGNATGDLFILDQHACDERRNLEKFSKTLKIDSQALLRPITTEISLHQAHLLLAYDWVFTQNGIKIQLPKNFLDLDASTCMSTKIRINAMP